MSNRDETTISVSLPQKPVEKSIIEVSPSFFMRSPTWLYGQKVRIKSRIVGFGQSPMNVPRYLIIQNGEEEVDKIDLSDPEKYIMLRNFLFNQKTLFHLLREYYKMQGYGRDINILLSNERLNMITLAIRDVEMTKIGETYIYHNFLVYLIGEEFPRFSKCYLEGFIVDDDKKRTTALIYSVTPLAEDFETIQITAKDKENFKKYFQQKNLIHSIDRTIKPKIVGRAFEKFMIALTLHSPLYINFLGETLRGTLHCLLIGDTATGKSKIINWIHDNLRLGVYGTGESGKRTGLLFTVDPEKDMIIWGLLVQADKTLALIDGIQRMSAEEIGEFREALRNKRIVVRMKVSGDAPARCRIIAAANPSLTLDEYVDLAEAIKDVKTFSDPVDITRWDIFLRFYHRDVPIEEIAYSEEHASVIPLDIFRRHILWAWSLPPEKIIFTDKAIEKLRKSFIELSKYSSSKIPLIHRGSLETFARLAASYAILTHHVDEKDNVIIDEEIAETASNLFKTMLDLWEYPEYVVRIENI